METVKAKSLLFFIILVGLFSCSEDDADLVGEWRLVEAYVDPGDGSGRFQKVKSKKVIQFYANGEVRSNGSLCDVSIDSTKPSSGTYSFEDSTIIVKNCGGYNPQVNASFSIEGKYLIIYHFCMEGCGEKYVKK